MPVKRNHVYHGDCLEVMADFPDNTFDAVITDPPYGLFFMGSDWDHGIPGVRFWVEMLRVCKPGAMLFAFGGTRTHHRLMTAIEDAGWEIRDCINHFYPADEREAALLDSMSPDQVQAYLELHYPNNSLAWLYGQGFPKSHAVGKAIDRAAGAERKIYGIKPDPRFQYSFENSTKGEVAGHKYGKYNGTEGPIIGAITAPATPAAQAWDEHGTALKPAWEPIIVAMKPIAPITSDALYQATGWNHWHHDAALKNTPKNRLKLRKKGVILKPDYGELETRTLKRKALHPGAESDTLVQTRPKRRHRSESNGWQTVGRYDAKPYRRWKTNSFAANALVHNVGGLWIDGCRIALTDYDLEEYIPNRIGYKDGLDHIPKYSAKSTFRSSLGPSKPFDTKGRWPANVLLSHHESCVRVGVKQVRGSHSKPDEIGSGKGHQGMFARSILTTQYADPDGLESVPDYRCHPDCPIRALDEMSGESKSVGGLKPHVNPANLFSEADNRGYFNYADSGTAARFFKTFPAARFLYTPKASRKERNQGLEGLDEKYNDFQRPSSGLSRANGDKDGHKGTRSNPQSNHHPTVKPQAVVEWLCSLSRTPTGGLVLDPFGGSGTTALACLETDRDYVLIEKEADYVQIARARIEHALAQPRQLSMFSVPRSEFPVQSSESELLPPTPEP